MHVQIDGDTVGRYDLRWRGISLSEVDGHTWSNSREEFSLQRLPDNSFSVPRLGGEALTSYVTRSLTRERIIHYRVLMEPIGTNVFFLAPWARTVSGDYRQMAADSGGAVYDFDSRHAISRYEADSDIAAPAPAELRAAGRNYPAQIDATYLRLPTLDPRVPALAAQITKSAGNDFDRAAAIENHLRMRSGYTLELSSTPV